MKQISVSQLQRNLHQLDGLGIVEIVDRKRNAVKGYFLDSRYVGYVREIAEKIDHKQTQKSARGMLKSYADPKRMDGEKEAWKEHVIDHYRREQRDDAGA